MVNPSNMLTSKVGDTYSYLIKHNKHAMAISETDIHGWESRVGRTNLIETQEAPDVIGAPGYSAILPQQWS